MYKFKLQQLFAVLFGLLVFACSKEEDKKKDEVKYPEAKGTYKITKASATVNLEEVKGTIALDKAEGDAKLTLKDFSHKADPTKLSVVFDVKLTKEESDKSIKVSFKKQDIKAPLQLDLPLDDKSKASLKTILGAAVDKIEIEAPKDAKIEMTITIDNQKDVSKWKVTLKDGKANLVIGAKITIDRKVDLKDVDTFVSVLKDGKTKTAIKAALADSSKKLLVTPLIGGFIKNIKEGKLSSNPAELTLTAVK